MESCLEEILNSYDFELLTEEEMKKAKEEGDICRCTKNAELWKTGSYEYPHEGEYSCILCALTDIDFYVNYDADPIYFRNIKRRGKKNVPNL
jgi:hypothetical protein